MPRLKSEHVTALKTFLSSPEHKDVILSLVLFACDKIGENSFPRERMRKLVDNTLNHDAFSQITHKRELRISLFHLLKNIVEQLTGDKTTLSTIMKYIMLDRKLSTNNPLQETIKMLAFFAVYQFRLRPSHGNIEYSGEKASFWIDLSHWAQAHEEETSLYSLNTYTILATFCMLLALYNIANDLPFFGFELIILITIVLLKLSHAKGIETGTANENTIRERLDNKKLAYDDIEQLLSFQLESTPLDNEALIAQLSSATHDEVIVNLTIVKHEPLQHEPTYKTAAQLKAATKRKQQPKPDKSSSSKPSIISWSSAYPSSNDPRMKRVESHNKTIAWAFFDPSKLHIAGSNKDRGLAIEKVTSRLVTTDFLSTTPGGVQVTLDPNIRKDFYCEESKHNHAIRIRFSNEKYRLLGDLVKETNIDTPPLYNINCFSPSGGH